jgi:hypothetical protein
LVLRDFLHKRPVIQLMNLFKLPVFAGDFELQASGAHRRDGLYHAIDEIRQPVLAWKIIGGRLPRAPGSVNPNLPLSGGRAVSG